MKVSCPICKKTVELGNEDFPFCSDRCRNIDLGNWATEKYVISEPLQHSQSDSDSDEE
jgi:endogenous inhibitor of DNA gyrase (YacG/DUF329 family)